MSAINRRTDTPESKAFWDSAKKAAAEVATWPAWKRAGINVSQLREEPRKSCGNCDFSGDGHCWESGFAVLLPDAVCDKWQEMLSTSLAKAAELAGKK